MIICPGCGADLSNKNVHKQKLLDTYEVLKLLEARGAPESFMEIVTQTLDPEPWHLYAALAISSDEKFAEFISLWNERYSDKQ